MSTKKTDDLHSLSHTKWNCKYHIVERQIICRKIVKLSNANSSIVSGTYFKSKNN